MEPLFIAKTKTKIDYKEYRKFSVAMMFVGKNRFKMLFIVLFLFAMLTVCYFLTDLKTALFCAVLYAVLFPWGISSRIKKTYKSDKRLEKEREFIFYQDRLETRVGEGGGEFLYEELTDIIETKTNFYLMIPTGQGIIIKKENCPPELIEFIRNLKKAE